MSLKHLSESASSPVKAQVLSILSTIKQNERFPSLLLSSTVSEAIQILKNYRITIPDKDPFLSIIDSVLVPLMELEYQNPASAGPYDIKQNLSKSFCEDCLLSDLNEGLLFTEVSDLLGKMYLSPFQDGDYDLTRVSGFTYGVFSRPMVSLPVSIGNQSKLNIHFLVDAGAPRTEIPLAAFEKFVSGTSTHAPSTFFAYVANRKIQLSICSPTENYVDIPLLGQDF